MSDLVIINPGGAHGIYGELGDSLIALEPPLWPRLIAGYVRDRGFTVKIVDAEAEKLDPKQIAARIIHDVPRLVCIAAMGHQPSAATQSMPAARAAAQMIKNYAPNIPIIMVGGHVAALPERTLREEPIWYACNGEGPETIVGLLDGRLNDKIPGLVWWSIGGSVENNASAPLIDMKDLHGKAWDLLPPLSTYRAHNWECFGGWPRSPYAAIMTSLGCPYKCLAGDTLVNTAYGAIPIKDLAANGIEEIPVFTFDPETKRAFVATARNIRCFGQDRLVRVHFDDGTHTDCTPDHQFLQFKWGNGRKKSKSKQWVCEAQNLQAGAHVRAVRWANPVGYPVVEWRRKHRMSVHRMVAEWMIGRELLPTEVVHHLDHNKENYTPENLAVMGSSKEHTSHHPEVTERMRKNNPAKGMTPEWRDKINAGLRGLKRGPEAIQNYRKAARIRSDNPEYIAKLRQNAGHAHRGKKWWTGADGVRYLASEPKHVGDKLGRVGFNAHRPVNHRVLEVEALPGLHDVYCLEVPSTGWFYANDVLVKNCSFCCIQAPFSPEINGSRYRMRAPADVVAEIKMLYHDHGVTTLKIIDEMFVLNRKHVTAICEGIIDAGLGDKLNIWAYARVDSIFEGSLDLLRKAGVRWLALGIESGSKYVRDGAKKALRNDDVVGIVRQIEAAGIHVISNFIFGLEHDSIETMQETLDLAIECNTAFANFYSAMAYPGSKMYSDAIGRGVPLSSDWRSYSQHNADCRPLDTRYAGASDVLRFRDEAFVQYFCRPEYLAMIRDRFGAETVAHIEKMLTYRLKRKLLETA